MRLGQKDSLGAKEGQKLFIPRQTQVFIRVATRTSLVPYRIWVLLAGRDILSGNQSWELHVSFNSMSGSIDCQLVCVHTDGAASVPGTTGTEQL